MRLGRIVRSEGVVFVRIEGEPDDPDRMSSREVVAHLFGTLIFIGRSWQLTDVQLLAPMLASKVVCIGKNYADHIAERGSQAVLVLSDPVIFFKLNTSIIGIKLPIRLHANASPAHFEDELALLVGRQWKVIPAAQATDYILRYTIGNDVSGRDQQRADGQWAHAKGYVTFCSVGSWIVTDLGPLDPADIELHTEVNGDVRQHRCTSMMIHNAGAILERISAVMALLPGDLILTGTPAGVGSIEDGDTVSITVEGIGTLTNPSVSKGKS
ncbi:2-hydroxyhepta-2,4-diene-1,7-dioate isomerase [Mycobacterium uberis]|uniref:2-hydroxyhepta-2,4-diene-1,7-dioate isomerase n=1 Tax=Mycobacterium uberis TaxID=2162698 RepID=A0A3E1HG84_9MYCO|nr:fumarylacetoacetate hydrolase family protein [Mycobacterium uberis]RFD25325.1 2-hydroxyhepta-2,4-diene-1,7-dioate isomerase [Mycobacterium uberis]